MADIDWMAKYETLLTAARRVIWADREDDYEETEDAMEALADLVGIKPAEDEL